MKIVESWRKRAAQLNTEVYTLYLACKDPRTPWHAKLLATCVVVYAFSPIDLIPDFIPVLGYVDDLILIPLGVALVLKMSPQNVLMECRAKAQAAMSEGKPIRWMGAVIIISIWIFLATLGIIWGARFLNFMCGGGID